MGQTPLICLLYHSWLYKGCLKKTLYTWYFYNSFGHKHTTRLVDIIFERLDFCKISGNLDMSKPIWCIRFQEFILKSDTAMISFIHNHSSYEHSLSLRHIPLEGDIFRNVSSSSPFLFNKRELKYCTEMFLYLTHKIMKRLHIFAYSTVVNLQ